MLLLISVILYIKLITVTLVNKIIMLLTKETHLKYKDIEKLTIK